MKWAGRVLALVLALAVLAGAFCAGRCTREQEYADYENQRCRRYLLFALDKVENQDIGDSHVMQALISNVYAAHEYCKDVEVSAQLSDLWNTLIVKGESFAGQEESLAELLREILREIE